MAARQDQGLVFTLIAFVILFIVAFVAAYVGWKSYGESETHVAELQNQLNSANSAVAKNQGEKEQLSKWMGVGQFDSVEDVEKTVKQDMDRYGANFDESRRSYRNIVEYLAKENESISSRLVTATDNLKKTSDQLLAVEAEKEKQVEQYATQMKSAEEDAASQRASFKKDRDSLEAKKQELLDNLAQQEAKYEKQLADVNTQLKELTENLSKSERAKDNLLAEASKSAESFEVPDGRIAWVNQDGTVWINLGSADALRRQITFSVYDADNRDPAKSSNKGSIEVTKILGDHMAEAHVTNDDPRNPILTGDQVYSQVWHRGKKLHFALAGIIDLNGDGQNDMKLARDMIELNGGVVDAYVADDGTIKGEINVNTRYLVLGDYPQEARQAAMQAGWEKLSSDAKTNGVEVITLDKFLNQIGYAPDDRVVQLGAGREPSTSRRRRTPGRLSIRVAERLNSGREHRINPPRPADRSASRRSQPVSKRRSRRCSRRSSSSRHFADRRAVSNRSGSTNNSAGLGSCHSAARRLSSRRLDQFKP